MPTYEYLCQTCSHRFEVWQKMSDEPLTVCPECGSHIRRVLYPAGIVFKGHGFYKTDHGNGALPASNGETHKADSNGESKSSENGTGTGGTKSGEGNTSSTKASESSTSSATGVK
jgi:putative FmdB family regulatory protein